MEGTGRYRVTFTTPFASIPTVVVTAVFGSINIDAGGLAARRMLQRMAAA